MSVITELDKGIIRNMMLKYSHKEISNSLGFDILTVAAIIKGIVEGTAIITRQMVIDQKKLAHPKRKIVRKPKKKSDKKIEAEYREHKIEKVKTENLRKIQENRDRFNNSRGTYKTKTVDLSKMVRVIIDSKTSIFVKPGEDKEAAIKKFYNNRLQQKKDDIY